MQLMPMRRPTVPDVRLSNEEIFDHNALDCLRQVYAEPEFANRCSINTSQGQRASIAPCSCT